MKIGLTGGIGSGKSSVADMLAEWGASIVDTDLIAHELTAPGGLAMDAIRQEFGDGVVTDDGALDRAAMRERVFRDAAARQRLESILHPQIHFLALERAKSAQGCYLVYVVPLLVESGCWRDLVDRVCVVDCDPATQIVRVQARNRLTPEAIGRIMSAQATREQRLAAADDVILNDGATTPDMLRQRTHDMHQKWCGL